ncbi:hypothetical protein EV361DRAFT_929919 [Lentinula raphanica]|nr:hypothetical protein EV361DRAFT_929919 [Lentinula raphanica]
MHLSTMFVVSAIAASAAICALPLQDVPRSDPSTSSDLVSDHDHPANLDESSVRVGAETSSLYPRGQCLSQSCCCCCSGDNDDDIQLTGTSRGGSRREGNGRRSGHQRGGGDDSRRSGHQRGEGDGRRSGRQRDDDRRRRRHRHHRPSSNAATYYDTSRSSLPTLSSQGAQGNTNNEGGPRRPPYPNPETPPLSSHESHTLYGTTLLVHPKLARVKLAHMVHFHSFRPLIPQMSLRDLLNLNLVKVARMVHLSVPPSLNLRRMVYVLVLRLLSIVNNPLPLQAMILMGSPTTVALIPSQRPLVTILRHHLQLVTRPFKPIRPLHDFCQNRRAILDDQLETHCGEEGLKVFLWLPCIWVVLCRFCCDRFS